ncbi:MAG TPA: DNA polymerase III subunit gamma/tau [Rudaea sp.]|jgi:DNA polymerase-3 subunit gamma/tau|nr:DNA polymerase III subunit gamma/tau [Rudaea sp.]
MSYQVLARKWRPKKFSELVGQEHVVRALSNALDSQRMHHAFLFTGTRGIGKTTIARIFAKSLNCERGQSSNPCGECAACRDIDAGRFMDMIEIDAASNTGVDNVRDLIENAQYSPSRGRFKVYLIDEVHMLSKSAFNALLKTLEEPPPHVKFLLATTDPEKLPVTVLSRCLKFNLKRLLPEQIVGQMRHILEAEQIAFDTEALDELARGADGSLRDGLSLLDQAIAYGAGKVNAAEVRQMLGSIERGQVFALIESVQAGDGAKLMAQVEHLAEFAPDFAGVLDDVAASLHRVQIVQLVGTADGDPRIAALADALGAEEVQLYYQIATTGRRDLPIAPTPRAGFEMALLRMLAFRPADAKQVVAVRKPESTKAKPPESRSSQVSASRPEPVREAPAAAPAGTHADVRQAADAGDWPALIAAAGLRGPIGQLAQHAALLGIDDGVVRLELKPDHEHLRAPLLVTQLQDALGKALDRAVTVRFEKSAAAPRQTPADIARDQRSARQQAAEQALEADPVVQGMIRDFGARVIPESIKAVEK